MSKLRVLHLEDNGLDALLIRDALEHAGFDLDLVHAASAAESLAAMEAGGLDVILSDSHLGDFTGLQALAWARERCPDVPFIVVSGSCDEQAIAAALNAGATDFVGKAQLSELVPALHRVRTAHAREQLLADLDRQNTAMRRQVSELEQRVNDRTLQLEAANRELEAFCYSVSHDLRAPLRGVTFYARMFVDGLAQRDERAETFLSGITSLAKTMGDLIDDLLKLSRIARVELTHENVDLTLVAQELVARHQEREPGRHVDVRIAPGLHARGDPGLLRVVLDNLLSNAWKYSSKRESAVIEFASAAQADGSDAFFVRDNGAGFDMQYADKLFTPFGRLHSAEEFRGSGIGLATVQRIMHRHGGRIWADAAVDSGATFSFTLPSKIPAQDPA